MNFKPNAVALVLTLGIMAPMLGGCPGVIDLKSKIAKSGPAKSTVAPILYDDFEKGVSGGYGYGNAEAGGACTQSEETKEFHGGAKSLKIAYKSGTGSWGCGAGWGSSYTPKEGYFNAKGTIGVEFWAKAPRGAGFVMSIKEAKANGGDEELFLSPASNGTGAWKKYFLPYEAFSRGIYSGNQAGDDHFEIGSIGSIEFQISEKQGDGDLFVDDIYFM